MATLPGYLVTADPKIPVSQKLSSNLYDYGYPVLGGASEQAAPAHPVAATINNLPNPGLGLVWQGSVGRSYKDDFYYRVHLVTSLVDVGNITKEVIRQFELWNAWLSDKTLTSITETGTPGALISGYPDPPSVLKPTESRLYDLTLGASGAPSVDTRFFFNIDTLESPLLRVLGRRVLPIPFPPHWRRGVTETLSWLTNVLAARDGKEQRIRSRNRPRRRYRYQIRPLRDSGPVLENLLYGWQSRIFGIPAWQQAQSLAAAAPAGQAVIPCDTSEAEFETGGMALLFRNERTWETVALTAVDSGSITSDALLEISWGLADRVMPMFAGTLSKSLPVRNHHIKAAQFEVSALIQTNPDIPAISPSTLYQGIPVLEKQANRRAGYDETWLRPKQATLDPQTGLMTTEDPATGPQKQKSYSWQFTSRSEAWAFRQTLAWFAGRLRGFWIQERSDDMQVLQTIDALNNSLLIRSDGYSELVALDPGRRDIALIMNDGSVFYRRIIDAVNNLDGTENISIDSPLGTTYTPAEVLLISFLAPVRLDHDDIDVFYHTTTVAEVQAIVRVIPL